MSPLGLSVRLLQAQPDERLLALAREGHEAAFEALVQRYRGPLLDYCRRISPEVGAEDVLQQALLHAWRALGAGVEVKDARAWLYRIARNVAISFLRSAGEPPAKLVDTVAPSGVEHLVEQRLAAREALAHLAALPELQREVMLGTAVEGRSHAELARALGVSGGSVRGLIYRARATLRAAAAALLPSPLVGWAVRSGPGVRSGGGTLRDAIAGGGSVGVAGALIKGGAAITFAGALAGAAAVVTTHSAAGPDRAPRAAAIGSPHRPGHESRTNGRITFAADTDVPVVTIGASEPYPASASRLTWRADHHRTRITDGTTLSTRPAGRLSGTGQRRARSEVGRGGGSDSGQSGTSQPDRTGARSSGSDGSFGSGGSSGAGGSSGSDGAGGHDGGTDSLAVAASAGSDSGSASSNGTGEMGGTGRMGGTTTSNADGSPTQSEYGGQPSSSSTTSTSGPSQPDSSSQTGSQTTLTSPLGTS